MFQFMSMATLFLDWVRHLVDAFELVKTFLLQNVTQVMHGVL